MDTEPEHPDVENQFSRITKITAKEERCSVPIYKNDTGKENLHPLTSHVFDFDSIKLKPIPENSSQLDDGEQASSAEDSSSSLASEPMQQPTVSAPKTILDLVREELQNDQLHFTNKERQNHKESEFEAVAAEKKWREKAKSQAKSRPVKSKVSNSSRTAAAKAFLSMEAEVSNDEDQSDDESDDGFDEDEFMEEDFFEETSDQSGSENSEAEDGPSFSTLLKLLDTPGEPETAVQVEGQAEADDEAETNISIPEDNFHYKLQYDRVNVFNEGFFQKGKETFLKNLKSKEVEIQKLEMLVEQFEKTCNTSEHRKINFLGDSSNLWKHHVDNQFCYLDNNDEEVEIGSEVEADLKRLEFAKKKLAECKRELKNYEDPSTSKYPKASIEGAVIDKAILPTYDFQEHGKVTYVPSVEASVPSTSWLNKEQQDEISDDPLQDLSADRYGQCKPNAEYGKDAFGRCSNHCTFSGPVQGYNKGSAIKQFLGFILRPCFRGYTFLGKIDLTFFSPL